MTLVQQRTFYKSQSSMGRKQKKTMIGNIVNV